MWHIIEGKALSRRTFLRGAGAAVALPFLDAMTPALAGIRGGSSAPALPLRTVFLFTPNGQKIDDWKPKETGLGFALPPILEPLRELKSDFSILSGLALHGAEAQGDGPGDHARSSAAFLTGAHPKKTGGSDIQNGVSIDQLIASRIGKETLLASLELGAEGGKLAGVCDSGYSCAYVNSISWRTPTQPLPKETNPRAVFSRLFGDIDQLENQAEEARKRRVRRSILDYVAEDAKRVKSTLGAQDRAKLDEYLTAVKELDERLRKSETSGKNVVAPKDLFAKKKADEDGYAERLRQMFDLIAVALEADMVRTVTFSLANDGSNRSYPNLGIADGHHDLSHHGKNPEKLAAVKKINIFMAGELARFLTTLKAKKSGDASLLDRTIVVYGSGISDGDRHNHDDLPILLAGGDAAKFRHGKHLAFKGKTPLTNLYLTILQRLGFSDQAFSDSKEPLAGL